MPTTRRAFLAAAGLGPATMLAAQRSTGGSKSYTYPELARILDSGNVRGRVSKHDLPTPALVLDLDAFEANLTKMAEEMKTRGRALRPHGKTHKCPAIARAQLKAGAAGICAAKLSEAEVFAAHGITGLLVTCQVVGRHKIERAVRLAAKHPHTIFSVDDPQNARELNDAAAAFRDSRGRAAKPLRLNVAVDLLLAGRTGLPPGNPAVELAALIETLPNLRFAGLQAYDGGAAHVMGFESRRKRSQETMGQAAETRYQLQKTGIDCSWLSGGSTGTYNIDSQVEGVTELQPGSYIFMDLDYNRIGGQDGPVYRDFKNALTVLTTVISRREGMAIVDGGLKAFSTDKPYTPEARNLAGVPYGWAGDEHGRLDLSKAQAEVKLGDLVEFVVPHCDPTVNLYDRIYGVRGEAVEVAWEISARGHSQ